MEATGVYYEKLAWSLHRSKESLSIILPNKAKKYLQSLGLKTKNDKIDAKGLSRMGAEQNLPLWEAPDKNMMKLRSVTRQREHLQETKTMTNNQLHALKSGGYVNEEHQEQLKIILYMFDQQIKETLKMIEKHVNSDDELKRKIENITVIKGLGLISVATVIAETNRVNMLGKQKYQKGAIPI